MKKKIIVVSLLLIAAALYALIRPMFVTFSVACMPEPEFCAPLARSSVIVQDKKRKLIKTGELSFECQSLDKTREMVEQTVLSFNGFVSDERLEVYERHSSQRLEIRVPADHFDAMMETIARGASRLKERNIRIEDVTDQYCDTEIRLSVKHELEARYRELLNDAQTVQDILAIEEQIAELREDIESAEGQLQRFDDRIALSTLEVTFYENLEAVPVQFAKHFRKGMGKGWENLVWTCVGIINIWPFILIIVASIIGFRLRSSR